MLQAAGRLEGDPHSRAGRAPGLLHGCKKRGCFARHELADVPGERADPRSARRIGRIIVQQAAIVVQHRAAGACSHEHSFRARLHVGPQRIDIAPQLRARVARQGKVLGDRPAAAAAVEGNRGDADPVQDAGRGRVDAGAEDRLDAPRHDHHATRVPCLRPPRTAARGQQRQLGTHRPGQHGTHESRGAQQRPRASGIGDELSEQVALGGHGGGPGDARLGDRAPDIKQPPILHPRRAGALAGTAAEAAIQVQLRVGSHRGSLEQLLHQVDAAARTVQLIAQDLVGRAGRQAEAAVHAAAQDRVRLGALR